MSTRKPLFERYLGWIVGRATLITLLAIGILSSAGILSKTILGVRQKAEIGYPDSYILYDVYRYVATGTIYKDLSKPPYNPTVYGPLLYWVLGKTTGFGVADNPFLGPRLAIFVAWIGCVLLVGYLSSMLLRIPHAGLWGALLAACIPCIEPWILQLRCDFFGVFFGLLAVILLYRGCFGCIPLAGCFAGLAIVFKLNFVAPLIAGMLWLLLHRDWRRMLRFLTGAVISSGTIFGLFLLAEPNMPAQMTSLNPPIIDVMGTLKLIYRALTQPSMLLALVSLPFVFMKALRRWRLILLFCGTSLAAGAATVLQAGGNINYFFEGLWAAVPLATLTIFRALKALWNRKLTDLGVAATLILLLLVPNLKSTIEIPQVAAQKEKDGRKLQAIESVLRERKVASIIPRLAFMTREPPITEPYLISYQLKRHSASYGRLFESLDGGEFDLVLTRPQHGNYRGVPVLAPEIKSAISKAYHPYCVYGNALLHLPRRQDRDGGALVKELNAIGCMPVAEVPLETVISW